MSKRNNRVRGLWLLALVALVVGLLNSVSSGIGASATPTATTTTKAATKGGFITTYKSSAGDTMRVYDLRGAVQIGSPPAMQTTKVTNANGVVQTVHQGGLMVKPPTTGGKTATRITNVSQADMVAALGADPATVAEFAKQDQLNGNMAAAMPASTKVVNAPADPPLSQLYDRACAGGGFDGTHGSAYGCWNQYLVYKVGMTWYFLDTYYGSGAMHDTGCVFCDKLTGLQMGETYAAGNYIHDWDPRESVSGGSCLDKTVTLGVWSSSVSAHWQQCPQSSGLYSVSTRAVYDKWNGAGNGPSNGSRTTGGTSAWVNPPADSAQRGISFTYWYTTS